MPVEIRRMSDNLGAEILGIDLSARIDDRWFVEIEHTFNESTSSFFAISACPRSCTSTSPAGLASSKSM